MFVLRRKHKLSTFTHYLAAYDVTSSRRLRYIFNLKRSRFFSNESTDGFLKEITVNSNIRKYVNTLVNKYQDGVLKNSNVVEDVNFESLSVILDQRIKKVDDIKNLSELVDNDVEMKSLAEEEESLYKEDLKELDAKLLNTIVKAYDIPGNSDVVLEIKAGVGGNEATIFVSDLCNMYIGYMKYLGLTYEIMEYDKVDQGGYRHISMFVSGNQTFEKLRYEGGVHRVQRIPLTEKSGRLHTSTASVAVIPDLANEEVELNSRDLKIETKRASGAGGQHVNTTDSAVRILHIPTGIVTTCQTDRSQVKNRDVALRKLRNLLYEQLLQKQTTFRSNLRKRQLGFGMRNEKIRTYNFQQDRVTDHRLENGTVHNIRDFLKGGRALEELGNRLGKHMQIDLILDIIRQT